jgi:hypothetical protein
MHRSKNILTSPEAHCRYIAGNNSVTATCINCSYLGISVTAERLNLVWDP